MHTLFQYTMDALSWLSHWAERKVGASTWPEESQQSKRRHLDTVLIYLFVLVIFALASGLALMD